MTYSHSVTRDCETTAIRSLSGERKSMAATTEALFADEGESSVTCQMVGNERVLFYRGLLIATFREGDGLGRDAAIATLWRMGLGLVTDKIAKLCEASHGWVCEVRKRYRDGGLSAVLAHAKRGPPRLIVGAKEKRLREMHGAGTTPSEIGRKLGVSTSLVVKEIKRRGLPRRGWAVAQEPLPGVGRGGKMGGTRKAKSPPSVARIPEQTSGEQAPREDGSEAGAAPDAAELGSEETGLMAKPVDEVVVVATPEGEDNIGVEEDAARVEGPLQPSAEQSALDSRKEVEAVILAVQEAEQSSEPEGAELQAGAPLGVGPSEHSCRYAGALLLCAAAAVLGVSRAIDAANVVRPKTSVYDATQVLLALLAAWGSGYGSLEAMHERDARALGVVLGLERSPSVRTLHRAIAQMSAVFDPIELNTALMRGVHSARLPERLWFGLDGHFKAYAGEAPIDKGWDSKRRIASKGLSDIVITDERGWTWQAIPVAAGDSLSMHLLTRARTLRGVLGNTRPIVIAFDRGGFDFDVLNALDLDGFGYAGYVPASVSLPDLSSIAPSYDGVGEQLWTHGRLSHKARLVVERDDHALIPVVTNLPTLVDGGEVISGLRARRGAQENSFKAARAFAHIDALVDRGGATFGPDDRLVPNPARAALKKELRELAERIDALKHESPTPGEGGRKRTMIKRELLWAEVDERAIRSKLRETPAKVPRNTIEPDAQRATLKTSHRFLLQPLKYAADNARRWLLGMLDSALAPTDQPYDQDALARTLFALLRAPGTVRFDKNLVTVTLDFPLPPTAHQRIAEALEKLDHPSLKFTDGCRRIAFRLAPRATRQSLPGRA